MRAETIFYIILWLFIFEFVLTKSIAYLNTLNWSDRLPKEAEGIYDKEKYSTSMKYERTKYSFSTLSWVFSFFILFFVLVFWGFWYLDWFVRQFSESDILLSLYFFGIIVFLQTLISLPFSYYSTFVIEEKFWFNKMTKKIFFTDFIKSLLLTALIWWLLLALIVWVYSISGNMFWIYTWIIITFFSVFMMMFYSSVIVPLFNKQTPLEKWKLRDEIEKFALKVGFKLDNIFVIDGSKRSSKANAYFSGFGHKKRIVLYDTLIKDLTITELVWVLAHEIGHYKRKHTLQMLAFSTVQTWFMLFIFSIALKYDQVSQALWAETGSFWVAAVAFGILFTPISIVLWLLWNVLSRRNEYQADEFAGQNYDAKKLQSALIKLSRNNLSNLTPHPLYEFFHYSHPTVLKRLEALGNISKK
jgi:STE24 endopeptidase